MENLCQIELNEGWNWLDWRVGSSHYTWYSRHDKTRSWPLEEEGWRVEGAWRSCGECNDPPISSSLLSSVRSAMQCNVNAVQLWSAHILPSPARSVSSLNFSLVGQCSILLVEDGLLLWTCGIGSPESWSSADPWSPFWLSVLISSKQGMASEWAPPQDPQYWLHAPLVPIHLSWGLWRFSGLEGSRQASQLYLMIQKWYKIFSVHYIDIFSNLSRFFCLEENGTQQGKVSKRGKNIIFIWRQK